MKTPLHLDYQHSQGVVPWRGWVLLVISLGLMAASGFHYGQLSDSAEQWEQKADQIERASLRPDRGGGLTERETRDMALEVKHANEVLHRLTLPWEPLFQAVESCASKEVALLAMEPDLEKRVVKISGEAKNLAAMLDYVRRLEAQAVFGSVYLQSHQVQQHDPEKPVRFAVLARWRG